MTGQEVDYIAGTVGIISLGCPKNTVDTERLLGELADVGWAFTDDPCEADCLIVNTCGFIRDAILESEEALDEICAIKEENPDVILVATGCLPQRAGIDLRKRFPALDLIVGVGSLPDLPRLLHELLSGESVEWEAESDLCRPGRSTLSLADDPRVILTPPWTAYLKIAEGCDHSCAFCTIPAIKGPYKSRPVNDIVEEAARLVSEGVRELTLISQDTTAYGSDIGTNLRTLLKELDRIDGADWIRLHYLYPSKVSAGLLDVIAESEHVLPYFDIPLQHVRPGILSSMNRLAPDADMLDIVRTIRSRFEGAARPACIRSTFIAGYPGEMEEDFQAMLGFLEEARIDRVTVFEFSPEEGTPAFDLPDRISEQEVERRADLIMELQQDISHEINEGWIGKTMEVLLEGETENGLRIGRSYRDAHEIDCLVFVEGVSDEIEAGAMIKVRVTGALPYDLEAKYVSPVE